MSDPCVEAGAAAAAAADGSAGKHRRQSSAGKVHQHHAGHRHRHPRVRLHGGQVHRTAAAQPPPLGAHLRGRVRAGAVVEELGAPAVRFGTIAPPTLTPEQEGDALVVVTMPRTGRSLHVALPMLILGRTQTHN